MVVGFSLFVAFLILGTLSKASTLSMPEIDFSFLVHIPKHSFGYLYGPTEYENEIKAAERVLLWYNGRLKSFISDEGLDVEKFTRYSEDLGKDLADIGQWVENLQPVEILSDQRSFANNMFKTMEKAVTVLKLYKNFNTAQTLIRWLVHFEVHLLSLYDVQGTPDIDIPNYQKTLGLLSTSLSFWKAVYYKLFGKSSELNDLFEYYVNQSENRLKVLGV